MTDLRVVLAGYGLAGAAFHAPLIEATDGLAITAVARSSGPPLQELLADADVLVVATPNALHVPMARAGIEAGLAVVVDKPLAPTAAQARELLALGGRLTVFHNRRWDDDFLTLRRVVAEGGDTAWRSHQLWRRCVRWGWRPYWRENRCRGTVPFG